jgi:hypothetical protein
MAHKVIDLRIYTIRPRGMPKYLQPFEELALPLARKHFGEPIGYYVTQIGPLTCISHRVPKDWTGRGWLIGACGFLVS